MAVAVEIVAEPSGVAADRLLDDPVIGAQGAGDGRLALSSEQ